MSDSKLLFLKIRENTVVLTRVSKKELLLVKFVDRQGQHYITFLTTKVAEKWREIYDVAVGHCVVIKYINKTAPKQSKYSHNLEINLQGVNILANLGPKDTSTISLDSTDFRAIISKEFMQLEPDFVVDEHDTIIL